MSNGMNALKIANTRNGFAIGLLEGKSYRTGAAYFEVVRMDRSSKYVVIHRTDDLDKARALANREWAADRAA